MKNIFITSINPGVGKTTFLLALALKLKKEGYNVGYFKPITDNTKDTDAEDAKTLLGMSEDVDVICPVTITSFEYDLSDDQIESHLERMDTSYQHLSKTYDMVIIEGAKKINYLSFLGLDHPNLASRFNSRLLVVSSGEEIEDVDRLILAKKYAGGESILGSVFTLVPDQLFQHLNTMIVPKLKGLHGITVFGLVPERTTLAAPTVEELNSTLQGRVLAGKDYMNKLVEDYIVGAMEPESALKYFRKSTKKAVITGGDRPQVVLAAMETDTSMIILTGSILPPAGVLARAEEKEIPVILVSNDTFSTVKKVTESHVYGKLHQNQPEKLEAWDKIFSDVNYQGIIEGLT